MALALTSIRPTFGSACMQVVGHGFCSRRRLERWRSAGARREVLAVCAARSFSFVCTQSHRKLTHNPCFVLARKQRERVFGCYELLLAATSAVFLSLLSLELSITTLAAVRGAATALGKVAQLLLWWFGSFLGFVAFVHF